jgi:hypothetical protein
VAEPLKKLAFPTLGWRQVLTAREKMLHEYDRARAHSRAHEVETYHGVAGEASVREWLADFLPKRYGVTAGYVISPSLDSDEKAPIMTSSSTTSWSPPSSGSRSILGLPSTGER